MMVLPLVHWCSKVCHKCGELTADKSKPLFACCTNGIKSTLEIHIHQGGPVAFSQEPSKSFFEEIPTLAVAAAPQALRLQPSGPSPQAQPQPELSTKPQPALAGEEATLLGGKKSFYGSVGIRSPSLILFGLIVVGLVVFVGVRPKTPRP